MIQLMELGSLLEAAIRSIIHLTITIDLTYLIKMQERRVLERKVLLT